MTAEATATGAPVAPLRGELRYGGELARLLADRAFRAVERRADAQPVYNNRVSAVFAGLPRVSAVFAGLPVGLSDPARRLERIRAEMDGVKQSKQAVGDVLSSLSGFAPPLLLAGAQSVGSETVRLLTSMLNAPLLAR